MTATWTVYTDGASRGNPGPASIGAVVYNASGEEVHTVSRRLGRATNNEAEYQAAVAGLEAALGLGGGSVDLRMDSQLIVRQLEFRYRVRNARLRPFFERVVELKRQFDSFTVTHVPREQNKRADQLANLALDSGQD
ncbi:MAG: ribonuclease HI family protein [Chloroflexi bacterium]|nr:ribonuclease HI family protein [Chloroflexota bacterium]